MALILSNTAKGLKPVPSLMAALVSALFYTHTFDSAAPLAAGDIIDLGPVPPDCDVADVDLIADDLDTGATLTLSVGFLNADKTDLESANATFITASTVGQAGGVARMADSKALTYGAVGSAGKRLGVKVVGAGAGSNLGKKLAVKLHLNA